MNIIIQIYIFICVMLLLFDIVFVILKNHKRLNFYKTNEKIEKEMWQQIKRCEVEEEINTECIDYLRKHLDKTENLISLQNRLEEHPNMKKLVIPYVLEKIEVYKKKSSYEQAFYLYVAANLDYKEYVIKPIAAEKFMYFLDSESLYTFVNAMNAIYKFGQSNLLLAAVDKIDERTGFYNKKLFVDGLLTYSGRFDEISEMFIRRFNTYQDETKESLLDFFRLKGIEASELCMAQIEDENTGSEVRYSAMRYFVKNPTEQSKEVFMQILLKEDCFWIEQLIATQGLKCYEDKVVKNLMMEGIRNKNWYIRLNASEYLYRQYISQEEILSILEKQDRYANEILLYQYRHNEDMCRYITQTIERLTEEMEAKKEHNIEYVKAV